MCSSVPPPRLVRSIFVRFEFAALAGTLIAQANGASMMHSVKTDETALLAPEDCLSSKLHGFTDAEKPNAVHVPQFVTLMTICAPVFVASCFVSEKIDHPPTTLLQTTDALSSVNVISPEVPIPVVLALVDSNNANAGLAANANRPTITAMPNIAFDLLISSCLLVTSKVIYYTLSRHFCASGSRLQGRLSVARPCLLLTGISIKARWLDRFLSFADYNSFKSAN